MKKNRKPAKPKPLSSKPALIFLLVVVALINFVTMPLQESPGDAIAVRIETVTLINTGGLSVPPNIATMFGDRGQYYFNNEKNGGWYSKYGIGNTLAYVPVLLLEKIITGSLPFQSDSRVLYLNLFNIAFSVATAAYLFLLTGLLTKSTTARISYVLAAIYCTFWWNHMRIQAFEAFQPFFMLGATYHFLVALYAVGSVSNQDKTARPAFSANRHLLIAGSYLGYLCLVKTVFVIVVPVFLAAIALKEWKRLFTEKPGLRRIIDLFGGYFIYFGIPLIVAAIVLLGVNNAKFGSPFVTGYAQWQREAHPMSGDLLTGISGYLFDPQYSIFITFPVLILAFFGYPFIFRRNRAITIFILSLSLVVILACAKFVNWSGGWSYGPRYLLSVLGLLSLPCVLVFEWMEKNIRRIPVCLSAIAVAALLLYSVYLQTLLNSLPFFTFYYVKDTLITPLKQPRLDAYFHSPYPIICRDVLQLKAGKPVWWWDQVKKAIPPAQTHTLNAYFKKISQSNYYFFQDES